jgi:hypothetical protein
VQKKSDKKGDKAVDDMKNDMFMPPGGVGGHN